MNQTMLIIIAFIAIYLIIFIPFMIFNKKDTVQKNWRMVKKGKHILFGCSLFFVVGGMSVSGSRVVNASETNNSEVVLKQGKENRQGSFGIPSDYRRESPKNSSTGLR